MATKTLQGKLTALDASLDELENCLGPLFAQSLPETLLGLETIQQAKLQTLLPYLLYDLVFIYLKTRGIDPRTHPVVTELERVKQYFDKIAKAEKEPETRTTTVDKAAAGRFIKHAIAQAKTVIASPQAAPAPSESTSSTFVAPKVTAKMVARAEYQQELRDEPDASDEDDAGLEVIDDQSNDHPAKEQVAVPSLKSQGKQRVNDSTSEPLPGNKRRRTAVDPFTGERLPSTATAPESQSTPASKSTKKRKTTTSISKLEATSSTVPSTSTPEETEADSAKKGKKKKAKKAKKAKSAE